MRAPSKSVLALVLALAGVPALACYTLYDSGGRIVYQSELPPVDMSRPLHESLGERFPPGTQLVFDEESRCPAVINSLAMGDGGPAVRTQSPLLTDERTARAMRAPHQSVGRDIAVIPPQGAPVEAGVSVVPTERPRRSR